MVKLVLIKLRFSLPELMVFLQEVGRPKVIKLWPVPLHGLKNVDDSDATVAFRNHSSVGTDKTLGYALTKKWQNIDLSTPTLYKPIFIVTDVTSSEQQQRLLEFLQKHNVKILNVCGHRETDLNQPKWTFEVQKFLEGVFKLTACV